jgi:Rod binding domain-containing protein
LLLRQILHDAQKNVIPSRNGADSSVNGIYQDLSTAQLADSISKSGGFGLARNLEKQLSRQLLTTDSAPAIAIGEKSKPKPAT